MLMMLDAIFAMLYCHDMPLRYFDTPLITPATIAADAMLPLDYCLRHARRCR